MEIKDVERNKDHIRHSQQIMLNNFAVRSREKNSKKISMPVPSYSPQLSLRLIDFEMDKVANLINCGARFKISDM